MSTESKASRPVKRRSALRTYGPNSSDRMALVSLNDAKPFRAYWPIRLTQLIGGRRWSLSFVTYQTPTPQVLDKTVEEAQGQPSAEELRIRTVIDQHLPTIITGLQKVVYQSIYKAKDELSTDDVALRAALSAAHWMAKGIATNGGEALYDLPSVLDLLDEKRKDAARIAELEAALKAEGESVDA